MLTANTLSKTITTRMIEIQAAWLIESFQKPITTEAALISAQSVKAFEYPIGVSVAIMLSGMWMVNTVVPTHSETHRRIDVTRRVLRYCTRKGKPGCHFTKTLHHEKDSNTGYRVAKQDRKRSRLCESFADTKEETSAAVTSQYHYTWGLIATWDDLTLCLPKQ